MAASTCRALPKRPVGVYDHRMTPRFLTALHGLCVLVLAGGVAGTAAAEDVRVALQKTGTLAWELDVARHHGLDRAAGLTVTTTELAAPEAGKIALRGGSADIIVSDWLWVARERSLGAGLVFYPYSSAVGAVMTPATSALKTLADLKGKKLAIAGGAIDKSWLILQGAMQQDGIDLKRDASVVY